MPKPLHRGVSGGGRFSRDGCDFWNDSQIKDRTEKEDLEKSHSSSEHAHSSLSSPFRLPFADNSPSKHSFVWNDFASETLSTGTLRSCRQLPMLFLKFCFVVIIILALIGSFGWTIFITTAPRGPIIHGDSHLQDQLVPDMWDFGEIPLGPEIRKELNFCSQGSENYVPCFKVADNLALGFAKGKVHDRHCGKKSNQRCLVRPPVNYKIPLRWPTGKDVIWVANVKITAQQVLSSGSLTKRLMMMEEEQISFHSASLVLDGVDDYAHQIAEMIGLRNESDFLQAGIRTILDIGCGYGSFGAHLVSKQLLTMCIADYETSGSQVQLTLERGLPAMIGSFASKQLPYPTLSFDMVHCSRCGVDWDQKEGILLIEADRVLRPGGYFVWTSPLTSSQGSLQNEENQNRWNLVRNFAESLCWDKLLQQDETAVWKKTSKRSCYDSRKSGSEPSLCAKGHDVETPYYRTLQSCIGGTQSSRWIPIEQRPTWPSRAKLNSSELAIYDLDPQDFAEDTQYWISAVPNYWSLLSPLIFSDHPKRPGGEDPLPPYNMVRNVLDMNSHFGGFNSALLEAGKSVWVMNVVPTSGLNSLPLILDRGFIGVLHDWCEAFPTYPRTYDMVHAGGLLSLQTDRQRRCKVLDLFSEIDRLLRPEGWVILRDLSSLIERARALTRRLKWDSRIIEIEGNTEEKLLICQKPFFKTQVKRI